jgi:hypothetical protein
MTTALEAGEGSASRPDRSLPPGKDPVPIVQEAGWAPGPVWTNAENLAPPTGLDPRTVQPVASRYTDYATRPTRTVVVSGIYIRCVKLLILPSTFDTVERTRSVDSFYFCHMCTPVSLALSDPSVLM